MPSPKHVTIHCAAQGPRLGVGGGGDRAQRELIPRGFQKDIQQENLCGGWGLHVLPEDLRKGPETHRFHQNVRRAWEGELIH